MSEVDKALADFIRRCEPGDLLALVPVLIILGTPALIGLLFAVSAVLKAGW